MSIVVSVGKTHATIYANSAKLVITLAEAFQLQAHLKYALEELVADQVNAERKEMIGGVYGQE